MVCFFFTMDVGSVLRKLFGEPARVANNFLFGPNKFHTTTCVHSIILYSPFFDAPFVHRNWKTASHAAFVLLFFRQHTQPRTHLHRHSFNPHVIMTRLLHLFLALAATASVAVSVVTDFKYQQWKTSTTCDGTPDTEIKGGACQDMTSTLTNNMTGSAIYESLTECKKGGTLKLKVFIPSKTCAGTATAQDVPIPDDVDTCIKEGSGSTKIVCGGAAATGISVGAVLLSALVAVISM